MSNTTTDNMHALPRLIAITGQEASGKDSYGNYLYSRGYMHVPAGDVLRNRARSLGYSDPIPRSVLSQVGDEMKKELGLSPITEITLKAYAQEQNKFPAGLVISGLRRAPEIVAFKKRGAVVLWIDADDEHRITYQFMRSRDDRQNKDEFLARSKIEYFGKTQGGKDGVNLKAIKELADCKVRNEGSLEELFNNADQALEKFAK